MQALKPPVLATVYTIIWFLPSNICGRTVILNPGNANTNYLTSVPRNYTVNGTSTEITDFKLNGHLIAVVVDGDFSMYTGLTRVELRANGLHTLSSGAFTGTKLG